MSALRKACSVSCSSLSNSDRDKDPRAYIPEALLAVTRISNSGISGRSMSNPGILSISMSALRKVASKPSVPVFIEADMRS